MEVLLYFFDIQPAMTRAGFHHAEFFAHALCVRGLIDDARTIAIVGTDFLSHLLNEFFIVDDANSSLTHVFLLALEEFDDEPYRPPHKRCDKGSGLIWGK